MARKRFELKFDGMDFYIKKLESAGGKLEDVAEKALRATFETVTPSIEQAIEKSKYNFNRSGRTKASLVRRADIEKKGSVYQIPIGFDIRNGGLASVFLMYGTPRVKPDKKLYSSIYGKIVRDEVKKVQQDVFQQEVEKLL